MSRAYKLPADTGEKVFRMLDSGVTPEAAANVLKIGVSTLYKHLKAEEARLGRKAKRNTRMRSRATGGDMRSAQSRGGKKGAEARRNQWDANSREEILARLAVQLRAVTEEWAARARAA